MSTKKKAALNQIIAIDKGTKSQFEKRVTELYHVIEKPAMFNGQNRVYTPLNDDGEKMPDESQLVQYTVPDVIRSIQRAMGELFSVEARKDWTNTVAKADIVIDGNTIVAGAPVPFMLFLEKKLTDLRTITAKLPVLDPAYKWQADDNDDLYKADPVETTRTAKIEEPLILAPATEKHPAQTKTVMKDVPIGTYKTTKLSGAISSKDKAAILERIGIALNAVKEAREAANATPEVDSPDVANALFGYIFPVTKGE